MQIAPTRIAEGEDPAPKGRGALSARSAVWKAEEVDTVPLHRKKIHKPHLT